MGWLKLRNVSSCSTTWFSLLHGSDPLLWTKKTLPIKQQIKIIFLFKLIEKLLYNLIFLDGENNFRKYVTRLALKIVDE